MKKTLIILLAVALCGNIAAQTRSVVVGGQLGAINETLLIGLNANLNGLDINAFGSNNLLSASLGYGWYNSLNSLIPANAPNMYFKNSLGLGLLYSKDAEYTYNGSNLDPYAYVKFGTGALLFGQRLGLGFDITSAVDFKGHSFSFGGFNVSIFF